MAVSHLTVLKKIVRTSHKCSVAHISQLESESGSVAFEEMGLLDDDNYLAENCVCVCS